VLARATERKRRYWDHPFGIRNKKRKMMFDGDTKREHPGG
jgi:hypothetical protein